MGQIPPAIIDSCRLKIFPRREYREAFNYGPAAPQSDPATGEQQDGQESEDCLMLNVWTRGINDGGRRPVMFWCHGGGFRTFSGSSPRYDGTNLAMRGDVVVVTINHRLNMMGFTHFGDMGHEQLNPPVLWACRTSCMP